MEPCRLYYSRFVTAEWFSPEKRLRRGHGNSDQTLIRGSHHCTRSAALGCVLPRCSGTGSRDRAARAPGGFFLGRWPWPINAGDILVRKLAHADDAAPSVLPGEIAGSLSSPAK